MAETKRSGAGSRLSGVLERSAQPELVEEVETATEGGDSEPQGNAKGRGVTARKAPTKARKAKARTLYLDDELFERILVQAHRKDLTISDYVAGILRRSVPDHRGGRGDSIEGEG